MRGDRSDVVPANNNVVNGQSQAVAALLCSAPPTPGIEAPPVIKGALHPCARGLGQVNVYSRSRVLTHTHTPSCVRWHFIEDHEMWRRARIARSLARNIKHILFLALQPSTRTRAEGGKRALGKYANRSDARKFYTLLFTFLPVKNSFSTNKLSKEKIVFFRFTVKSLAGSGISSLSVLIVSWYFWVLLAINWEW